MTSRYRSTSLLTHVVEKPPTPTDQLEEPAAGVMVTLVDLQVLGQVHDALAQEGDLHLGRAGVRVVEPVLGDGGLLVWHGVGVDLDESSAAGRRHTGRNHPSRADGERPAGWPGWPWPHRRPSRRVTGGFRRAVASLDRRRRGRVRGGYPSSHPRRPPWSRWRRRPLETQDSGEETPSRGGAGRSGCPTPPAGARRARRWVPGQRRPGLDLLDRQRPQRDATSAAPRSKRRARW